MSVRALAVLWMFSETQQPIALLHHVHMRILCVVLRTLKKSSVNTAGLGVAVGRFPA
jgi:hypothetical protein